jgi:hypothetical protein
MTGKVYKVGERLQLVNALSHYRPSFLLSCLVSHSRTLHCHSSLHPHFKDSRKPRIYALVQCIPVLSPGPWYICLTLFKLEPM